MTNPYAYYEESPDERQGVIWPDASTDSGEGRSQEPRLPITLSLTRGRFGGRVTLETTREQCEFTGASLHDSLILSRDEAFTNMRIRGHRILVRLGDGRWYTFRCRRDKFRELSLARLETWRHQRWHDEAEAACQAVADRLRENVIRPVLHYMILVTVFQTIISAVAILDSIWDYWLYLRHGVGYPQDFYYSLIFFMVPPLTTLALAIALSKGRFRAVLVTLVLSIFPLMAGVLYLVAPYPLIGLVTGSSMIVLASAVIVSCVRSLVRYILLSEVLEFENREEQNEES